jgi:hypothetical protein
MPFSNRKLRENRLSKNHSWRRRDKNFVPTFYNFYPICIKVVRKDVYENIFNDDKFNKYMRSAKYSLPMGVNELPSALSTFVLQFTRNSV